MRIKGCTAPRRGAYEVRTRCVRGVAFGVARRRIQACHMRRRIHACQAFGGQFQTLFTACGAHDFPLADTRSPHSRTLTHKTRSPHSRTHKPHTVHTNRISMSVPAASTLTHTLSLTHTCTHSRLVRKSHERGIHLHVCIHICRTCTYVCVCVCVCVCVYVYA
jgi:hypothetical protein